MKLTNIKKSLFVLLGCLCLTFTAHAQKTGKSPYTLFDSKGVEISYDEMIKKLSAYDLVFIGEMHNCPITHWLEFEITRSLYAIHKDKLTIGEEMLEADNQLILDEYMQRKIDYDRFEAEARLWDNYSTDYSNVVYFAKENGIPFVATNVPRRYANAAKRNGLAFLDSLSDEAKRYMAPLPITFKYDEEGSQETFAMMNMMGGHKGADTKKLAQAQAIKDATMAWFIAKNLKNKFIHLNGNYHTDNKAGIIPYLLEYRPGTKYVTITSVRQDEINKLEDENKGRADFYICVSKDMTTSY